jgi:DNA-binding response OmpR family regulator
MTALTFDFPTRVLVAANGSTLAVRRAVQAAHGDTDEVRLPSDALRKAQTRRYDAILIDLTPSSYDMLSELAKLAPVVVLVEHEGSGTRALLAGASAVISKQVRPQELVGTLIRIGRRECWQTRVKTILARVDEACIAYCRASRAPFPA